MRLAPTVAIGAAACVAGFACNAILGIGNPSLQQDAETPSTYDGSAPPGSEGDSASSSSTSLPSNSADSGSASSSDAS